VKWWRRSGPYLDGVEIQRSRVPRWPAVLASFRCFRSTGWPIQEKTDFNVSHLNALFELTTILGGLGKRTRRAMGGVKIIAKKMNNKEVLLPELTIDYIAELVGKFNKHFQKHQNSLINTFQGIMQKYPWIKQIEIGNDKGQNIQDTTSRTTNKLHGKSGYENNLGHAKGKNRCASPIIVSVLSNPSTPVITTLNTVPFSGNFTTDNNLQNDFKSNIL
jgi:CRISPR-associated protein Cmr1